MRRELLKTAIQIGIGTLIVYVAYQLALTKPMLGVGTAYIGAIFLYGIMD